MTVEYCDFLSSLTKSERNYRVESLYEDFRVYVPIEDVSKIELETREDPYLISIVLGLIEAIRLGNLGEKRKSRRGKIDRELKINVITKIVGYFSAEEIIDLFSDLKLHEILEIFNSNDPIMEIKEMLR